jgi:hypothetical protein
MIPVDPALNQDLAHYRALLKPKQKCALSKPAQTGYPRPSRRNWFLSPVNKVSQSECRHGIQHVFFDD